MQHTIERDSAPPPPRFTYPFRDMEIGDSFVTEAPRELIAPAAAGFGKRHNRKFSVRREGDNLRVRREA